MLAAAALSSAAIAAISSTASAQLYWDRNGATAGAGATPTGSWNLADANWTGTSAGTVATSVWTNGSDAVFSAGTDATTAFTVTIPSLTTVVANSVTHNFGTLTIAGPGTLQLSGTSNLVINSGRTANIGAILDGGAWTKLGTGTLNLTGANTFTGAVTIGSATAAGGTVVLSNANALGTAGGGVSFPNATTVSTTGLALSGGITVAGEDISLTNGGIRSQNGQLTSLSGSNTWSGNISINGSINNEGIGLVGIGAASGATLTLSGVISSVGATGASGNTWAKIGAGTVILTGASPNTNQGFNRILNGMTIVEKDQAFGVAAVDGFFDSAVVMSSGLGNTESIAFRTPGGVGTGFNYSTHEEVTMAGTIGIVNSSGTQMGQIDNLGGANIFNANIRMTGPTIAGFPSPFFGVQSGSLELPGKLYSTSATAGPTPRTVTKIGPGNLIISGTNDGTDGVIIDSNFNPAPAPEFACTGTWTVAQGTLTLRSQTGLPNSGMLAGSQSVGGVFNIAVNPGAGFVLDESNGVNTVGRLSNGLGGAMGDGKVFLVGGDIKVIGNATQTVNSSVVGGISVGGYSTMTVVDNGMSTVLDIGSNVTRNNHGTVLMRGFSANQAIHASSPTLIGGGGATGSPTISIMPFALGDNSSTGVGTDFVTFDSNGNARCLTGGEYTAMTDGLNSTVNTTVNSNLTLNTQTSVNSIKIPSGVTLTNNTTLTVNSGAIFNPSTSGTATISTGGTIVFSNEGVLTAIAPSPGSPGGTLEITDVLKGAVPVTKSGYGTVRITNAANDICTGGLDFTINAGTLEYNSDGNLSQARVVLNGGALRAIADNTIIGARHIELGSSAQNIIDAPTGITLTNGGVTENIDGNFAYRLTKEGGGTLIMNNPGSGYTGGTIINAGTLQVTNVGLTEIGPGSITFNGGQLYVHTGAAVQSTSRILFFPQTGTITMDAGMTTTWSGVISGSGTININTGTFDPQGNNGYTGSNWINNGTIKYTVSQGKGIAPAATVADYYRLNNGTIMSTGTGNGALAALTTFSATMGITLVGNGTFDITNNSAGNGVSFPDPIAGNGNLNKTGPGDASLTIAGSMVGNVNIFNGKLFLGTDAAIGSTANNIFMSDNTLLGSAGNSVGLAATRTINLTGSTTVTLSGGAGTTFTINGPISGAAVGVVKGFGGGTLVLNNTGNNFASMTVATGTLVSAVNNAVPQTAPVTVGSGQLAHAFNVNTGVTQTMNSFTSVGTGTQSMNGGAANGTFAFNNSSANMVRGALNGNLAIAKSNTATLSLTGVSGTYSGGLVVNGGTVEIGSEGQLGAIANPITLNGGALRLGNNALTSAAFTGTGSGYTAFPSVTITGGTQTGTAIATAGVGAINVVSGGTYTAAPTVTVAAPTNAGGVTATAHTVLTGNQITSVVIDNVGSGYSVVPTITLGTVAGSTAGSVALGALALQGLALTGVGLDYSGSPVVNFSAVPGATTATGSATATNLTNINSAHAMTVGASGGTLSVTNDVSYGGTVNGPGVLHKNTGSINFAYARTGGLDIRAGTVSINQGRNTANTSNIGNGGLAIAGGSAMDMKDQDMVLDKTGTSLTQVQSFIASAYSGDTWTGSGITSSTIAANNAVTGNLKLALGYIENLDPVTSNAIYTTFSGQTVNTNNILVKYGYSGDADLNGTVDSVDFGLLVQSFGQAGKFWYNGDFNYSGSVDSIDFSLLAANFAQVLNSPAASAVPSGAFDPGSVGGLVPEPSALTALGIAAGGILARRRRRS